MRQIYIQLFLLVLLGFFACKQENTEEKEGKGGMEVPVKLSEASIVPQSFERPKIDINKVKVGGKIDQHNGVPVYFNGRTFNTVGRHMSADGYNYGLKWQCVEFVKRYYYDHLKHKMPDTYGHAKDFFLANLEDGQYNWQRDLQQFRNGGLSKPKKNDIIVFVGDEFGHVAIVSKVEAEQIEIVQQNVGIASRHTLPLFVSKGRCYIMSKAVIGWLGKRNKTQK